MRARGADRISGRDCRSNCQEARGSCAEYTKLEYVIAACSFQLIFSFLLVGLSHTPATLFC